MEWSVRWLRKLWHHPLIVLTIGTMVVWALENYYTKLLTERGTWSLVSLALVISSVVILYWVGRALWRRFVPRPSILVGFPPAAHRGLIFLYSKPETLRQAITHHQPRLEYLCLVVSDGSVDLARKTIEQLQEERQLAGVQVREERITDHWNPDETALAVERAIRQGSDLALAKCDLICDVTGGTKAMTTGALLTCLAEDLLVQMVAADYTKDLDAPKPVNVIQLRLT